VYKLENFGVLATRVRMEEWDNHKNPEREFSLELGQKLEIVTRNPEPDSDQQQREGPQ
jgi:hypothetical protein